MIDRFVLRAGAASAIGFPVGSGIQPEFVVEAGSTALVRKQGADREGKLPIRRQKLVEAGILLPHPKDPDLLVFAQNHRFETATAAGDIVNGANISALDEGACGMTEDRYRDLVGYVTSNDRVWPLPWHEFSRLIGVGRPGFLPPLILEGAMESDASKRERLLKQIAHIKDDPELLAEADVYLRSLKEEDWFKAPDPLSTKDRW